MQGLCEAWSLDFFVATEFTLLIHLAGLYLSGNYPFNMNVAADCLEQWATGSWKKCPPLKVDWPMAQAYQQTTLTGSTCLPEVLARFGSSSWSIS